jgi:hypothetical protein
MASISSGGRKSSSVRSRSRSEDVVRVATGGADRGNGRLDKSDTGGRFFLGMGAPFRQQRARGATRFAIVHEYSARHLLLRRLVYSNKSLSNDTAASASDSFSPRLRFVSTTLTPRNEDRALCRLEREMLHTAAEAVQERVAALAGQQLVVPDLEGPVLHPGAHVVGAFAELVGVERARAELRRYRGQPAASGSTSVGGLAHGTMRVAI